jgi:GDP/UDP-N,N'-diacetylbacillosamine 2-epimerase (hydrolysing)
MKRKICVISGKRGGFGALIRTMQLIEKDPDLELQLILTDMHLSREFGYTIKEVDGWFSVAEKVDIKQKNDTSVSRTGAMGLCMHKMAHAFNSLKPDILLIIGDRGEVFASAIAAANLNIPIAHIQGGDVSGNVDEVFRHAITKLSHIHFPATEDSARRIRKMGEEKWRIHVVGDVHVDLIKAKMYTPAKIVRARYRLSDNEDFMMVLYHPVTTEPENSYKDMKNVLKAVMRFNIKVILTYPCSDQGYQGIIDAINEVSHSEQFHIYKNIEAPDFLGLLSCTKVLIGNSSSGLIEAPYFKLPVVNVGKRQLGRLREENVIDVEPKTDSIYRAINMAFNDNKFHEKLKHCGHVFGNGKCAEKIVGILKNIEINKKLIEKRMTY